MKRVKANSLANKEVVPKREISAARRTHKILKKSNGGKNVKKRIITLLIAAILLISLAACGTTPASSSTVLGGERTNRLNADGFGGYKIGFWYLPPSDLLSQQFRAMFDYCAELTNCEMVYYDMVAWSAEDQMAAVESLVSSGCDAIINPIGSSPAMYEYLNDSGVYYAGLTRSYTEELAKIVDDSEYCTGWIGDLGGDQGANFMTGYNMAQLLVDAGCKKIAIVGASEGETMNDERVAGVEKAAKEAGMEILTTYRGGDFATGYSDILASYGDELDGIACTGGGDQGVAAIQAAGLSGKIKLVQVDPASENTRDYLEAGLLHGVAVGGATYLLNCYMQVFNALTGADRLFNEGSKIVPQFIGFFVQTAEEWDMAAACLSGEIPGALLPDEVLALNSLIDPGMTVQEREQLLLMYQSPEYWNITAITERINAYLAS